MHEADNLPPYCAVVKKSRSLNFLDPSGPAWPVTGVLYFYLYILYFGILVIILNSGIIIIITKQDKNNNTGNIEEKMTFVT